MLWPWCQQRRRRSNRSRHRLQQLPPAHQGATQKGKKSLQGPWCSPYPGRLQQRTRARRRPTLHFLHVKLRGVRQCRRHLARRRCTQNVVQQWKAGLTVPRLMMLLPLVPAVLFSKRRQRKKLLCMRPLLPPSFQHPLWWYAWEAALVLMILQCLFQPLLPRAKHGLATRKRSQAETRKSKTLTGAVLHSGRWLSGRPHMQRQVIVLVFRGCSLLRQHGATVACHPPQAAEVVRVWQQVSALSRLWVAPSHCSMLGVLLLHQHRRLRQHPKIWSVPQTMQVVLALAIRCLQTQLRLN